MSGSPQIRRSWSAGRARPCHYVLDGYNGYFSTLMPIERAVPAMIFSAASIVVAFRSGILVCAMSRTWAAVMLPTLVLCGSALPLSTPAAFLPPPPPPAAPPPTPPPPPPPPPTPPPPTLPPP